MAGDFTLTDPEVMDETTVIPDGRPNTWRGPRLEPDGTRVDVMFQDDTEPTPLIAIDNKLLTDKKDPQAELERYGYDKQRSLSERIKIKAGVFTPLPPSKADQAQMDATEGARRRQKLNEYQADFGLADSDKIAGTSETIAARRTKYEAAVTAMASPGEINNFIDSYPR